MANTLIHCPNCHRTMTADDSSDALLTCPDCGVQFSRTEAQAAPQEAQTAVQAASQSAESYLQQAKSALEAREYLLSLDAAKAALNLQPEDPDAIFYQQMAAAFASEATAAEQMLAALAQASSASEGEADRERAKRFSGYLSVVCRFLQEKCSQTTSCLAQEFRTEEELSDMRAGIASLLEACIHSAEYLPTNLLQAYPEGEDVVLALAAEGDDLIARLREPQTYYDLPSGNYLQSNVSSEVESACEEAALRLKQLRESLPSVVAKQEQIRRRQEASKSSVRSYWEAHPQEQALLQSYVRKNRSNRIVYLVGSVVLFAAIVVGWGIGLKALVGAGISRALYLFCIFGLMLFMAAYWIIFSLIYRQKDFKARANTAKRYLASPLGKSQAIEAFLIQQQNARKEQSAEDSSKHSPKKWLVASVIGAVIVIGVSLTLAYWIIPAANLRKGKHALEEGDALAAIGYLDQAGNYGNAKELLSEQLETYRLRAISYDGRAAAYNNIFAVRDAYGDIYYMEFSSTAHPDVAITNAERFLLTQNYIVALRSDGYLSYSQYTTTAGAAAPEVSEWSEIVSIGKMNNTIVGYQEDGTLVYNSIALDAATLARLSGDNVVGIYDKFGDIAVRSDGTASLPDAANYSYADKVEQVFQQISKWQNLAVVKGDITNHIVGLTKDGRVYAVSGWFDSSFGELNVSSWRNIVDIASGESHTVGLRADGTVVAVGSNSYGQCDVSDWTDIVAIEAGNNFTMGIASDGTLYVTGHDSTTFIPRGMTNICLLEEELPMEEDDFTDILPEESIVSEPIPEPSAFPESE